jgi:hypothetical protein
MRKDRSTAQQNLSLAAIDQQTGGVVLRHHDEVELIALCRRLEWNMDDAERETPSGRPRAFS